MCLEDRGENNEDNARLQLMIAVVSTLSVILKSVPSLALLEGDRNFNKKRGPLRSLQVPGGSPLRGLWDSILLLSVVS